MTPPRLVEAAEELFSFLRASARPACLIGGMVVSRWGEPRATKDVDATVLVDFKEEAAVLDLLLSRFGSRDPDPVHRAELGRLALLRASNGVDLEVGALRRFSRSRSSWTHSRLRFGSPAAFGNALTSL